MYQNLVLAAVNWNMATTITVCGIVIVFLMLLLLVWVLSLSGKIFVAYSKKNKDKEDKPIAKSTPAKPTTPIALTPVKPSSANPNDEIIAVISAAVSAMYEGTEVKPIIKRIRKLNGKERPAWTSAGIYENTRSF